MLIRKFSGMPEGTTFAILIMNLISPLLDQKIKKPQGFVREKVK
jgi:Na+-translocating ferredoxin:NAD+ oxidoreductase RnfD subunit